MTLQDANAAQELVPVHVAALQVPAAGRGIECGAPVQHAAVVEDQQLAGVQPIMAFQRRIPDHRSEGAKRAAQRADAFRWCADRVHHREIEPHLPDRAGFVQRYGGGAETNVRFPILETEVDGALRQ